MEMREGKCDNIQENRKWENGHDWIKSILFVSRSGLVEENAVEVFHRMSSFS